MTNGAHPRPQRPTPAWASATLFLLAGLGAGCASSEAPPPDSDPVPPRAGLDVTLNPPAPIASTSTGVLWDIAVPYELGTGDVLKIGMRDVDEVGGTTVIETPVSGSGVVALPLIGTVQAAGLTTDALRETIRDRLASRYVRDPFVTVQVASYRSRRIAVFGEVASPGFQPLERQQLTVLEVLAMVGGRRAGASHEAVVSCPHRVRERGGLQTTVDLDALDQGDLRQNILVHSGDTVRIPRAGSVRVTGYVRAPGGFPYRKGMTAFEAVTLAGGLEVPEASPSMTRIRREAPDGGVYFIDLDLGAVAEAEAPDVPLQPGDLVEVRQGTFRWIALGIYDFVTRIVGLGVDLGRFIF